MKSFLRSWGLYLLLLAIGFALALAAKEPEGLSVLPVLDNPGPQGAAVLKEWLGAKPYDGELEALDARTRTLVIAAPTARKVTKGEADALSRWIDAGGTLVYLSPALEAQPVLSEHFGLERLDEPPPIKDPAGDLGGTTVEVRFPHGLAAGTHAFRVAIEAGLSTRLDPAIAIAEHGALLHVPLGEGELWLGSGPSLLENRRLELADNAKFWANLAARGPLVFVEKHQTAGAKAQWTPNLWLSLGQLTLLGLVFVWMRARRLGPARPTVTSHHRGGVEYVRSMGNLLRDSGVERELLQRLSSQVRLSLQEQLGIPLSLSAEEAARALESATGFPAERFRALEKTCLLPAPGEREWLQASREAVAVMRAASGISG